MRTWDENDAVGERRQCSIVDVLPLYTWDAYFSDLPDARARLSAQMAATITGAAGEHHQRRFGRYLDTLQQPGVVRHGGRLLDVGPLTGEDIERRA